MSKTFSWNETNVAEAINVYKAALADLHKENGEKDAVNSREAIKLAAEAVGTSEASARLKLNKENVYIKVEAKKPAKTSESTGTKRVDKAKMHEELIQAFAAHGVLDVDTDIVSKLTGKAAAHLAEKVRQIAVED